MLSGIDGETYVLHNDSNEQNAEYRLSICLINLVVLIVMIAQPCDADLTGSYCKQVGRASKPLILLGFAAFASRRKSDKIDRFLMAKL